MKKNKITIAISAMFFLNIIGSFALFYSDFQQFILRFSSYNLLLLLLLFYWANNNLTMNFLKLIVLIFSIGLMVEIIGVNYKFIFGSYTYGESLGYKIFGTPIIIGVNWASLSLACFGISSYLFRKKYLIVLVASFFMVFTDYIIEPIASILDFWHWSTDEIPLQNYIAWFGISLFIQFLIMISKVTLNPKLSFALLFSQLTFFIIQYFNDGLI